MPKNIDFAILSDPDSPDFLDELKKSPQLVKEVNAPRYFETLLSLFAQIPSRPIGKTIMKVLYEALSRDSILEIFASQQFALSLPYSPKYYLDEILDILYLIVTRVPNTITSSLSQKFETLIRHRGKKTLMLIMFYSQHFNSLSDPWPIIDLLFIGSDRFSAFDTASQYVMLLSLLIQSFPEFRANRCQPAWQIISQLLTTEENNEIIRFSYEALAGIESVDKSNKVDYTLATKHLRVSDLQSSVLSLLLLAPIEEKAILNNHQLIINLVKSATKNVKATLILMNLCTTIPEVNEALSSDSSWIKRPLPTFIDTLRLFLVFYKHIKGTDYELPHEFSDMIIQINGIKGEVATNLMAIVLRKIELNQTVFDDLCNSQFFENFIKRGNDDKSFYNYLLMADTIGRFSYTSDLISYCPLIYDAIEKKTEMFAEACQVGINLCRHNQLKKEFKKIGIVYLLHSKLTEELTRKHAKRFLKALDEYEY
ncbi:hypothetical protein TRFO_03474 [Tritrichomonas foetus]|uniref:Uncharacterized protein n=1 Tax=Tritrichomonas foetus TaxID=1144522 RepID=A0A1J4KTR7_9EUKA|nr:hypothetical protein TRFO_03474 [Tritrichomonas foetus]|eukprot:OHT13054.1 hypothetical protein TRFO_03474 [Tritrichomonas foetus]